MVLFIFVGSVMILLTTEQYEFVFNKKLGIRIPHLTKEWDEYSLEEQKDIIHQWENERAKIPDRVKEIENEIEELQDLMFKIEFDEYVKVHKEIVEMSSAINDLNIWYRTEGELTTD